MNMIRLVVLLLLTGCIGASSSPGTGQYIPIESGTISGSIRYITNTTTSWCQIRLTSVTDSTLLIFVPTTSDSNWTQLEPMALSDSRKSGLPWHPDLVFKPNDGQGSGFGFPKPDFLRWIAQQQVRTSPTTLQLNLPAGTPDGTMRIWFLILPAYASIPDTGFLISSWNRYGHRYGVIRISRLSDSVENSIIYSRKFDRSGIVHPF